MLKTSRVFLVQSPAGEVHATQYGSRVTLCIVSWRGRYAGSGWIETNTPPDPAKLTCTRCRNRLRSALLREHKEPTEPRESGERDKGERCPRCGWDGDVGKSGCCLCDDRIVIRVE